MFKELKSLVDKLLSECDEDDEEEDYDEDEDEEEDYDEDEDEEHAHPRRIVAVAYDASIPYDSTNKCPKPGLIQYAKCSTAATLGRLLEI